MDGILPFTCGVSSCEHCGRKLQKLLKINFIADKQEAYQVPGGEIVQRRPEGSSARRQHYNAGLKEVYARRQRYNAGLKEVW